VVTRTRAGERVAQEIRERILSGELQQGDELPSETQLVSRFGVSRPTLRDALRILETEGLIRVRRGRSGGATVLQPTADRVAYYFGMVLQRQRTTIEDIARARNVLEPVCAGLCASRLDHQRVAKELAALVETCAGLVDSKDPDAFPAAGLRVHNAILDACGSTTLRLLLATLESVWADTERRLLEAIHAIAGHPTREERVKIVDEFRTVVESIAAGDRAAAEAAMDAHARRMLARWSEHRDASRQSPAAKII
jgi:GntR family transcriptional regulator, transcriptional repressor for pyruvate dehydrogenase complex